MRSMRDDTSGKKYSSGPRRPIDKELVFVKSDSVGTTQDAMTIRTSTVAETYTGGHITIAHTRQSGGYINIVLAVIPEGLTVPTVSTTDGESLYQPEEHVVWATTFRSASSSVEEHHRVAKIKAMRKMKNGDRLVLIARGSAASVGNITCVVTAFFKQ